MSIIDGLEKRLGRDCTVGDPRSTTELLDLCEAKLNGSVIDGECTAIRIDGDTPWCDAKVAFDIACDEAVWAAVESGALNLPEGWELCETDKTGAAGCVAIFCIEGPISIEAGQQVKALLDALNLVV
tara:strand:- start:278 stop:658 length:381 start_codon:yes stop_codon:yes gene_type:complete